MRFRLLVALVAAASVARADSSVGSAAPGPPGRCNDEDGPHWKARRELDGFRRGAFDHGHLVHATPRHLLLAHTRGSNHPAGALVLDRATRASLLSFEGEPRALVEDASGIVIGTLRRDTTGKTPALSFREAKSGNLRWSTTPPGRLLDDAASTVLAGDLLVIAHFHRYATGAACSRSTRAPKRTATSIRCGRARR
jgi:hypothetical protein